MQHNPDKRSSSRSAGPADAPDKPTLLQLVWSMVAAFCGVQNEANHDRDDSHLERAGFMPYIVIGILMTLLFIVAIAGIVQLILRFSS